MSRRRSSNPTKPINITVPTVLLDKLHDELGPSDSRSLWITGAIRMRLEGTRTIDDASSKELLAVLVNRGYITNEVYQLITSSS